MKTSIIFSLFFLASSFVFSQEKTSTKAVTNVYHNLNNITLKNTDGTSSSIYVNGNSARLVNPDGSHSTIDFYNNRSTLVGIDGTQSTIVHNGRSSTVFNSDGTQFIVNHKRNSSTCSTKNGIHSITHFFGMKKEMKHADRIDVLIHTNWLAQKNAATASIESDVQKH